jgi:hypothetical protein
MLKIKQWASAGQSAVVLYGAFHVTTGHDQMLFNIAKN